MEIGCPFCHTQHKLRREAIPDEIVCGCGHPLDLKPLKQNLVREARRKMKLIRRGADRICSLILMSDYPEIDIEIEKSRLRDLFLTLFHEERLYLYQIIYESRFNRLRQQFRGLEE